MSLKYPEIYNISEIDKWISTYVRKELVTTEWDLISNEVAQDVRKGSTDYTLGSRSRGDRY